MEAARDAELFLALFEHDSSLIAETSVRINFATVLQSLAFAVADLSAAALQQRDIQAAREKAAKLLQHQNFTRRQDYWRNRLFELRKKLSSDFKDWSEIWKRLADLEKLFWSAKSDNGRHTLGAAFVLWCAVLMIGESCPTAQKHLQWMRSATARMPGLAARYHELRNTRNFDKLARADVRTLPVDTFRAEIYSLWRALGTDWR